MNHDATPLETLLDNSLVCQNRVIFYDPVTLVLGEYSREMTSKCLHKNFYIDVHRCTLYNS